MAGPCRWAALPACLFLSPAGKRLTGGRPVSLGWPARPASFCLMRERGWPVAGTGGTERATEAGLDGRPGRRWARPGLRWAEREREGGSGRWALPRWAGEGRLGQHAPPASGTHGASSAICGENLRGRACHSGRWSRLSRPASACLPRRLLPVLLSLSLSLSPSPSLSLPLSLSLSFSLSFSLRGARAAEPEGLLPDGPREALSL